MAVVAGDALLTLGDASAAPAELTPPPSDSPAEIIVTARLREERLQDVPIAMSVIGKASLAARDINTLGDLAAVTPGLTFRTGASNKDRTLLIRGIGTITTSAGVEPSVSTVVDGVVLVRPGQQTLEVADIEQVEVLKGPQGTLFGRNASAGVVSVTTASPPATTSAMLDASRYGGGDERRIKGSVGGPIVSDLLSYRVSALYADYDGNVRNITTGSDVNGYRRRGARAKFRLTPSADLALTAILDYAIQRDTVPYSVLAATRRVAFGTGIVTPGVALTAAARTEGIVPAADNRTIAAPWDTHVRDRNYGVSLQADWSGGPVRLTAISAWRAWRNLQTLNLGGLARAYPDLPVIEDRGSIRLRQLSQEVRATSAPGAPISFTVGAFLLLTRSNEHYRRDVGQVFADGRTANDFGLADFSVRQRHVSLYGEGGAALTERLKFILGGRLIGDRLSYRHQRAPSTTTPIPGVFPAHFSTDRNDHVDYAARFGLQYRAARGLDTYLTFSRGYKGPAYNVFFQMRDLDEQRLAPETSQSVELGAKGSLFDRRLSFAADIFYTRYDDFQTNFTDAVQNTVVVRLINAGRVSTRGIEGDVTARPDSRLTLRAAAALIDARIDRFRCPQVSPNCSTFSVDGWPLPFAPRFKANAELAHTTPIGERLTLTVNADYSYTSRTQYQLDQRPDTIQPGYGIVNASIALAIRDQRFALRLVAKNLADKSYSSYLAASAIGGGIIRYVPRDDRRYFGVGASVRL